MIKRLLQTLVVLLPSIALYITKRIGLNEIFTIIVGILVYYILYNSKSYHNYQNTAMMLHPQFPETRSLSITDIVEYLCVHTHIIPAAIIMVITVYKMSVLLFEYLIITGKPFTLEIQVLSEGDALFYVAASVLVWLSSIMLYPAFSVAPVQVSKYLYEKHNVLIED